MLKNLPIAQFSVNSITLNEGEYVQFTDEKGDKLSNLKI